MASHRRPRTSPRHYRPWVGANPSTSLRAKRSNPALAPRKRKLDCFVALLLAMTWRGRRESNLAHHLQTESRDLAARCTRVLPATLKDQRAQGMPGARCARSLACRKNTRVSHHGHTGTTRHSRAKGLTVSFVLSPVTGLSCNRHQRNGFRQLDTSVGESGPHDFAVRMKAPSSLARLRPPHPAPRP